MITINDPELAAGLTAFEQASGGITLDDIPATREFLSAMAEGAKSQIQPITDVESSDQIALGENGNPDVMVRIFRPENCSEALPALLWIHGGGYVLGSVEGDDSYTRNLAKTLNCVVASVEYRLAPEHPYPAPLEDCYTALKWISDNADQLGIIRDRIAIGGASAGGGLAAGLGLLARDRKDLKVCYQLLIYPMIDDRNVLPASETVQDTPLWTRANNLIGWRSYLGREPGDDQTSIYAAPARAENLEGLPPTFIGVGTPDLFRDEDISFAHKLMQAGVPTELHVYVDGFHGFDQFAPMTATSQRFIDDQVSALIKALMPNC